MAVIQPNNKSLFAKNRIGKPLLLSSATFILRVNDPQPSNGSFRFKYKADTGKVELSTDNGASYSGDYSVTSDGSTFNNNVGSSGLDFILESNPSTGDEFEIDVKTGNSGEDTYIDENRPHRNYGATENLFVGTIGAFNQVERVGLIRFNIGSYFSDLFGTEAQWEFIETTSSFIRVLQTKNPSDLTVSFYGIADSDSGWIPGTAINVIQNGSPDYEHKAHDTTSWDGGIGNPALDGSAITEEIAAVLPSSFYIFNDVGGRLNSSVDRWLKDSVNNGIRTVHVFSTDGALRGSDTLEITTKPFLVFVYEVEIPVIPKIQKRKGLEGSWGLINLTLGDIDIIAKSEIPLLSNIAEVYRSANRIIGRINTIFPGVMETELAFTRKVANTTENLTFASADPDTIVTTTDLSALALPGRVAYIYGTLYNDGLYYIGSVSTVTITLVGISKLVAEGPVSATISIYELAGHEILPDTNTILTYTASTMTDSGLNDFERLGVEENDIVILVGTSNNDGAYSVASSKGLDITLQSDESLNVVSYEVGRIRIIRPSLAYQFDAENNELILPDYVKEVVKLFENKVKLDPRTFEYINDLNNSSQLAFNTRERSKIRFPSGIGNNADDEIHIKVKKDIIEFLYPDSISTIEIPASMEEVIIAGTLSLILAKPKYRDTNLFKFNNDIYVKGLKEMAELEIDYEPQSVAKRDYDYFPETTEPS